MLKHYLLQEKQTGELVTYSEAKERFYKKERTPFESIFDEYEETKLLSNESIGELNFNDTKLLNI